MIAREAGISEPILYRHFGSKRELFIECLDAAWARLRAAYEAQLEKVGYEHAVAAISKTSIEFHASCDVRPTTFWIQALSEAGEDVEIRSHLRRQLQDVHDFVADTIRRSQAVGGIPADRDPEAEAWIFVGAGVLLSFSERLGGLLDQEALGEIAKQRRRWLTGTM
jgi:AcrR family transcriptional regulator